jgi:hypothetical protein
MPETRESSTSCIGWSPPCSAPSVQPDEFWSAVSYITALGQANEAGLLVPGLGIETFLDLRMDEAERKAGIEGGTPRTIEGPLYVAGAPLSKGEARLDDGSEQGEILFMHGQVRDMHGSRSPVLSSMFGMLTPSVGTRSSIRRSLSTTCAAASKPMPGDATRSGLCCHRVTAAHRMPDTEVAD